MANEILKKCVYNLQPFASQGKDHITVMQIMLWLDNFPFWNRQKDRFWQFWWVEVWWLRRQHPGRHNKPQTSRLCKCQTNLLIVHLNGRPWNSESVFVLLLFARRQKQRRRRNFWKQDGNVKQCCVTQLQLKHKHFNSKWALFNPWLLQVAPTSWAKTAGCARSEASPGAVQQLFRPDWSTTCSDAGGWGRIGKEGKKGNPSW